MLVSTCHRVVGSFLGLRSRLEGGEFFFFQAEDGIRDLIVTGVQTCALPIWPFIFMSVIAMASSTAALAVGDAIAITLMKMKGLSEQDYARLHPGGQLGKRLLLTDRKSVV